MTTRLAPVVLFVYNRLDHTRKTIDALQKNLLAGKSDLIIFSDGARNAEAFSAVAEVRSFVKTVKGFNSVTVVERAENMGLARSIIHGVAEICNQYGKVIVLEDDLVTSPYFLEYMNGGLDEYEFVDDVISIHGYIYPTASQLPATFFLRGADCWGWATWKRGWDLFDADAEALLARLLASGELDTFDFNGSYGYTDMLRQQIDGKISSWAIRWYASAFLANKLTLYPGVSLVHNIGHDSTGTHGGNTDDFSGEIAVTSIPVGGIAIEPNAAAFEAVRIFFLSLKKTLGQRVLNKLRSWRNRLVRS